MNAPRVALRTPGPRGWSLTELLAKLERISAKITVTDDQRLVVEVPAALDDVLEQTRRLLAAGIKRFAPLLIATDGGKRTVACDLCKQPAQYVAVGGAFVCAEH